MQDKLLFKFEFDNIWYFIEKENNNIKYYIIKGGEKNYSLTKEQIQIVKSVIQSFIPSKEILRITKYLHNGILYDILYDKKTKLYFFNPIPKKKDLMKLNLIFNNKDYIYKNDLNKGNNKEDNKFFKRVVKVLNKKIILYIECSVLVTELAVAGILINKYSYDLEAHNDMVEKVSDLSSEQLSENLNNAINSNKNITEEEKEELLKFIDIIIQNKDYTNIHHMCEVLETIRFEYNPNAKKDEKTGVNILGEYDSLFNKISFYNVHSLKEVEQSIINHEISHCLTRTDYNCDNEFLTETTNTIFNEEYTHVEDNNIYKNYTNYTKALMEIIGVEPFKKYHGFSSDEFIINALCEVINDRDKAIILLNKLDIYKTVSNQYEYDNTNEELLANKTLLEEQIKNEISDYYNKKYNRDMDTDMLMLYYTDINKFNIEISQVHEQTDLRLEFKGVKNYFVSDINDDFLIEIDEIEIKESIDEDGTKVITNIIHPSFLREDERYIKKYIELG